MVHAVAVCDAVCVAECGAECGGAAARDAWQMLPQVPAVVPPVENIECRITRAACARLLVGNPRGRIEKTIALHCCRSTAGHWFAVRCWHLRVVGANILR